MTVMHPLDGLEHFYRKYVVLPSEHHYVALPLWAAHTYIAKAFDTTPRLFLDSALPGSGKTRVLELLDLTAFQPMMAFSASPAAIIRTIAGATEPPTILFDEIDTIFGAKASSQSQELAAVINAGYKSGATVPKCVGNAQSMTVVKLDAFAPVALAGLHSNVPEATRSRSIHFRMQRRKQSEKVQPFRRRSATAEVEPLVAALAEWVVPLQDRIGPSWPEMPTGVDDRDAEVWEPLLALADAAGGEWPRRAREACTAFVFAPNGYSRAIGIDLLSDIRTLFQVHRVDQMKSADVVSRLVALTESEWGNVDGAALTQRGLAKLLRPFDVRTKSIKCQGSVARGYAVFGDGGLHEAWERNLEPDDGIAVALLPDLSATSATAATPQVEVVASADASSSGSTAPVFVGAPQNPPASEVADVADVAAPDEGAQYVPRARAWLLDQELSA
ncbi:DUF3631 domain-containing protein [Speluncibacter jeojiensis]|uniref:DUF3631 domain-containing protein n=1 Tax=Speluncibacter jeojiensis TaxID=2710754 RepID=A0A9X4LZN1_9ACTN|nr:DUF3631 domain-containing protein [Corynebacteriales bacterium D3-21]